MYKTEVNSRTESPAQIPAEVISQFAEAKQTVLDGAYCLGVALHRVRMADLLFEL